MIHLKLTIIFYLLKANGKISWVVRNFISIEANVLKIYKTLIRPHMEYCTQAQSQDMEIEV